MIEAKPAPAYRHCNCCSTNKDVIEVYFRSNWNQGTCIAICENCFEILEIEGDSAFVRARREKKVGKSETD